MSLDTYDPKDIVLVLAGIPILGFAPGTFITLEKEEDTFKDITGAQGDVLRVRSRNDKGVLKFTLNSNSDTNTLLSALHLLDRNTNNAPGPMALKDLRGASIAIGSNAYIVKPPAMEYGTDETPREWVVNIPKVSVYVVGGAF